jgi:hypothetical protein
MLSSLAPLRPSGHVFGYRFQASKLFIYCRSISSQPEQTPQHVIPIRNPRWLSDQKTRLGKCITFGLDERQVKKAGIISQILGEQWKGLVAGPEGFLVSEESPNNTIPSDAWEEKVVWGEMV